MNPTELLSLREVFFNKYPDTYMRFGEGMFAKRTFELIAPLIPNEEVAFQIFEKGLVQREFGEQIPSLAPYIRQFLKSFLSNRKIDSVLDPWANVGEMLSLVAEVYPDVVKKGYVPYHSLFELNQLITSDFDQTLGNSIELLGNEKESFDLIISALPLGMKSGNPIQSKKPPSRNFDFGLWTMLECLDVLKEDGLLIGTVPGAFFNGNQKEKFINLLSEKGFCIQAIFDTPAKSVIASSIVPVHFVVIQKGKQGKIFQAEINSNTDAHSIILYNYRRKKRHKHIEDGIWVEKEDIKPIYKAVEQRNIDLLLREKGLPIRLLSKLGKFKKLEEINGPCLIISRVAIKNVEIGKSKEEVTNPKDFLFEVDLNEAEPAYLKELLNSNLGQKIRKHAATGNVIRLLTRKNLEKLRLPVEDIDLQRATLDLDRQVDEMAFYFKNLKKDLWRAPRQKGDVDKKIKKVVKSPNNFDWIEELPFPVASILWGYYSEIDSNKKVEYLFHFFEGLCQFLDVLLLSGLSSNEDYYSEKIKPLLKNKESEEWYVRASFGGWQKLHEKLAKIVRQGIKNKEEKEFFINLFGGASEAYLNTLSSKELLPVFSQVINLRNRFKGHGGISSEKQTQELLRQLRDNLDEVKELLVDGFRNVELVSPVPKSIDFDEEMFTASFRLMKGTRSKFRKVDLRTNKPVTAKKLYLLHENEFNPIEVVPLIQMRKAPESEQIACYFYNRIEKGQVRMVSYHFEDKAEVEDPFEQFRPIIEKLRP